MSFSENTSDSDWKETKIKVARHIKRATSNSNLDNSHTAISIKQKYSQKFCEKWLSLFEPWLARSSDDQNKPFCRACQCRLDCNRCHLMRHERTTKHKRNLEALITKGEGAARMELSVRQERSKYYHQRKRAMQAVKKEPDIDAVVPDTYAPAVTGATHDVAQLNIDSAQHFQLMQNEANLATPHTDLVVPEAAAQGMLTATTYTRSPLTSSSTKNSETTDRKGLKLLMQIHQDKSELMDSFRELMGSQATHNPTKEKNHVDLFFESVSSSVKALSPKLIAEAKMRVSQLICELELRALKDDCTNVSLDVAPSSIAMPMTPLIIKQSGGSGQNLSLPPQQSQNFATLS